MRLLNSYIHTNIYLIYVCRKFGHVINKIDSNKNVQEIYSIMSYKFLQLNVPVVKISG